ncbi:TPA: SGNH/GDSL hydrolase family protein [Klebsiella pneumoniae subsp. pneumoniae]|nr:SGNH/GDSL hydrolase family protein [Klebsiella pneumoniae subsp. pneumoniae]
MANLPETSAWESGIHQLEEADRAKAGPGGILNLQASQLANRTSYLKVILEGSIDFKNLTFFITEDDPDGTISGISATSEGDLFRVAQGGGSDTSFIYYVNKNSAAEAVTSLPSNGAIEEVKSSIADISQSFSRELRSSETFHSSVMRTSNWTNATTSTWAVGSTSDGRVFNFIEMWVDGINNIDSLKISIYSRSVDGATIFPGANGDKLLSSKIINMNDVAIKSSIATGYQLIRLVFDDTAVPADKTALFVVQPLDASGNPVYMGCGRQDIADSETAALSNSLGGFWMPVDQSEWRRITIPETSLYRIAFNVGYESPVNYGSFNGESVSVASVPPNSPDWAITGSANRQFYGWVLSFPGKTGFNSITLRHSNLTHVNQIYYRAVLRKNSDVASTSMPGTLAGDIQVYAGRVHPDAPDDGFYGVNYSIPNLNIPAGYFVMLVVYPRTEAGETADMGTQAHEYSTAGETAPSGFALGAFINRVTNTWQMITGTKGVAYWLNNVSFVGVVEQASVNEVTLSDTMAKLNALQQQVNDEGAQSVIRESSSNKWGYATQPLAGTFFRWAVPIPHEMDTLNEIELWLDGLALNDYLRIKVFARAIDMTGSKTPPGELEGDAEIYSEDIPVYLKSTGTAMTRIPFRLDVAIPEGAFPLISVEAFLPENGSSEVIGYLGAGAALYSSATLPVLAQRGWYSRRGINGGAWTTIGDGQTAAVAYSVTYKKQEDIPGKIADIDGRLTAVESAVHPLITRYLPVVSVLGRALDFSGSAVVANGVSQPVTGSLTLDATSSGSATVEGYSLRQTAATSQWPSNVNAWLGYKRISNVVVTDASTGTPLVEGTDYNIDSYGGKLRGLTATTRAVNVTFSYVNERYDLVYIDPVTLAVGITKGTDRIFDVQEYRPAVPSGKVALYYALVAGSSVELEPVYRWPEAGCDMLGAGDADFLRQHNRRCLQKTLARLNQGKNITLVGYGDSITAVSNIASPETVANGSTRDLQRILQGYATDTLTNLYPAQDWSDGGGAVHVKIGWNWRLKEWMEETYGVTVDYLNFGVSGTNSTSGVGNTRMNAVIATAPHVTVVCFGMNDNAGNVLYGNLRNIIKKLKAAGSEVVIMPVPRTPSHEDGRYTLEQWRYINGQVYRAAMDEVAAYVPTDWLTDENSRGGMGIVPTSLCGSDLRNHPGGYEFSIYGKALVNAFCF